jgi:hypothetical protein
MDKVDAAVYIEEPGQDRWETVKHHYDNQQRRSLQALDLITSAETGDLQSQENLRKMDMAILTPFPDYSLRIDKPGIGKNGTASFQTRDEIDEDGKYRYFETNDALLGSPQIPFPNILLALNRYTRMTVDQDEFIMRVPLFGKDVLGKTVSDDITDVIELTMDEKTFEAMVKAVHEIMWRDDKKGLYSNIQKYGLDQNLLPESSAMKMVAKNMGGLFARINQPLRKVSFMKTTKRE